MNTIALAESVEPTVADKDGYPWRRYGARMLDVFVLGGVLSFALLFAAALVSSDVLQWITTPASWKSWFIFTPLQIVLTIPVTAAFLAWKGTTPGKWMFGIGVRADDGAGLSYRRAIGREARVLLWGMALGIPLLSFVALIKNYADVEDGGKASWDRRLGLTVEVRPAATMALRARIALGVVLLVALYAMGVFQRIQTSL